MPPSSSDPPVYKSHPLYRFRRHIIISDLAAILLFTVASLNSSSSSLEEYWFLAFIFVLLSGLLALADLWIWTVRKHDKEIKRYKRECQQATCHNCSRLVNVELSATASGSGMPVMVAGDTDAGLVLVSDENDDDNDKQKWPLKWIMILDFLIVGPLFFIVFCAMINGNNRGYYGYYDYSQMYLCYATVPIAYSIVLHARCWWREWKARQREAWLRELGLSVNSRDIVNDVENDAGDRLFTHRDSSSGMAVRSDTSNTKVSGASNAVEENRKLAAAVKAKLQTLNPEVVKALKSKGWLPVVSNTGERQPLLSSNTCTATHPQLDNSFERAGRPSHGNEDNSANDPITTRNADLIIMDLPDTNLTPDGTASTSDTSSTADLSEVHESQSSLQNRDETGEGGVDDPNLLDAPRSRVSSIERDKECFMGQDIVIDGEEIMVVRKAKKGKTRSQKGKGRASEAEL